MILVAAQFEDLVVYNFTNYTSAEAKLVEGIFRTHILQIVYLTVIRYGGARYS